VATGKTLEVLERLLHPIDKQSFYTLYGISTRQPWLERKQNQLVELWNLCDTTEQRDVVLGLLERFRYLSGADIDEACQAISTIVKNDWKCGPQNTLLAAVASDTQPDGSQSILQCLKNHLIDADGWKTNRFFSQLTQALDNCKAGSNLILVEDFVGSGDKVSEAVDQAQVILLGKGIGGVAIHSVTVAAMKESKAVFDGLKIPYHCVHWLDKGISDYHVGAQLAAALGAVKELSAKLSNKHNGQFLNPLGYKKSESIVWRCTGFCVNGFSV